MISPENPGKRLDESLIFADGMSVLNAVAPRGESRRRIHDGEDRENTGLPKKGPDARGSHSV